MNSKKIFYVFADIEPYLLVANKQYTRKYTLNSKQLTSIQNVEHDSVYLMDYDYREGIIYFADYTADHIKRMNFDGTDETLLNKHHTVGAEGIAFDWIAK